MCPRGTIRVYVPAKACCLITGANVPDRGELVAVDPLRLRALVTGEAVPGTKSANGESKGWFSRTWNSIF